MAPRNIIIDTDPGQDDAVAILLALASPEDVHVLGITAVAGNVANMFVRNANIIRFASGGSVEKTNNTRGDIGQWQEQRHQVKIQRPFGRNTKQLIGKKKKAQQNLKTPMSK